MNPAYSDSKFRPGITRPSPVDLLNRELNSLSPEQRALVEAQINPQPIEEEPTPESGFGALLWPLAAVAVAYVGWRVFSSSSPAQQAADTYHKIRDAVPETAGITLADIKAQYQ